MSKYYYHLTNAENLNDILINGIKCKIGDNSKKVNEKEKRIYLCSFIDIPYWEILLNRNIIIQIDKKGIYSKDLEICDYGYYKEIVCKKDIFPRYINIANINIDRTNAMRKLCLSYLLFVIKITELSFFIHTDSYLEGSCEVYEKNTNHYLSQSYDLFSVVLDRLSYSCLSKNEIKKELEKINNDNMHNFCDFYKNPNHRLWKHSNNYNEKELKQKLNWLNNYIDVTFEGYLHEILDIFENLKLFIKNDLEINFQNCK